MKPYNRRRLTKSGTLALFLCIPLFMGQQQCFICYPNLPAPRLVVEGTVDYVAHGQEWTRYDLGVTNASDFPDALFAAASDLPPCGLNTNSSRTWVDIYDGVSGGRIYGFCALGAAAQLDDIWFAVERGANPPESVYIVLTDRRCNMTYTSNLAPTAGL